MWYSQSIDDTAFNKVVIPSDMTLIGRGETLTNGVAASGSGSSAILYHSYDMAKERIQDLEKQLEKKDRALASKEQLVSKLEAKIKNLPPKVKVVEKVVENQDTINSMVKFRERAESMEVKYREMEVANDEIAMLNLQLRTDLELAKEELETREEVQVLSIPDDALLKSIRTLLQDKKILFLGDDMLAKRFSTEELPNSVFYSIDKASTTPKIPYSFLDLVVVLSTRVLHKMTNAVVEPAKSAGVPVLYLSSVNFSHVLKEIFITLY
jgi:hypothetical protein